MDTGALIDGLILYLCFIPVLTLHEFAHAWMASKCGDDTARSLGRVSVNPVVHICPVGTVLLPLMIIMLSASGGGAFARFLIGWGKPVPVNINNLRHRRVDDTLVAMAGPVMNILLVIPLLLLVKLGDVLNARILVEAGTNVAVISLFLCFFNLLPIPPLDGSHLVKNAVGMSDELYWRLSRFGIVAVIIALQFPVVKNVIAGLTFGTLTTMARVMNL